ncbi:MAG: metallopeptidase family protein, partial [Candidatus Aminicenantes bacterium]|nr:metallopeptidase family protein [Candidatus Aminicenantes bacterium]
RLCQTEEEVSAQIRETVIHEIAHYFGFSEAELRRVERETRPKKKGRT